MNFSTTSNNTNSTVNLALNFHESCSRSESLSPKERRNPIRTPFENRNKTNKQSTKLEIMITSTKFKMTFISSSEVQFFHHWGVCESAGYWEDRARRRRFSIVGACVHMCVRHLSFFLSWLLQTQGFCRPPGLSGHECRCVCLAHVSLWVYSFSPPPLPLNLSKIECAISLSALKWGGGAYLGSFKFWFQEQGPPRFPQCNKQKQKTHLGWLRKVCVCVYLCVCGGGGHA